MATLVLSTVGNVLGGPAGAAIGSLLGQSIDQQLLGPGPRRGPRLGDLAVQSSSYGAQIPQLFGTMRVAGSIVWATDLTEASQTVGAKGQPESITYSYSVSMAVALSSRPVHSIGRIWADGKLLRGAGGDFKVATDFRFYSGTEDQPCDPLIASVEGISRAPAYRGLAIAVFENLQLAEFGNRIPFLTFEVLADAEPATIGEILTQASSGSINCSLSEGVGGYAAYGDSIAHAVEPLVRAFDVQLVDNGVDLGSPADRAIAVMNHELGCAADRDKVPLKERSQVAAGSLPSEVTVSYYDPERDYQTGLARASFAGSARSSQAVQLPASLSSATCKRLAEQTLAGQWARRDRLTLHLPPSRLGLEPGCSASIDGEQGLWIVEQVRIDRFAVVVELAPRPLHLPAAAAESGRSNVAADLPVVPTTLELFEAPFSFEGTTSPTVLVAASCDGARVATSVPVELRINGQPGGMRSVRRDAVLGHARNKLAPGVAGVFDLESTVEVQLVNRASWLESCDNDAIAAGGNLALLGGELLQFGEATPLGGGRFRLQRFVRGAWGTEYAMNSHASGEAFLLLGVGAVQSFSVRDDQIGAEVSARALGQADSNPEPSRVTLSGKLLKPLRPAHMTACMQSDGSLKCRWVRRSRRGWGWGEGIDVALEFAREAYRLRLSGSSGAIDLETGSTEATFTAAQLLSVGSSQTVEVRQVGDLLASPPATLNF